MNKIMTLKILFIFQYFGYGCNNISEFVCFKINKENLNIAIQLQECLLYYQTIGIILKIMNLIFVNC